jgi:hypothetical protein
MDVKENPMEESIKYHIPEEIPANERTAFHGAAAAAAKAGKKKFNFGGKTHPVTMKKDLANKIADQKESKMTFREKLISVLEGDRAAHYKSATTPEGILDKSQSSKGAMDMAKGAQDKIKSGAADLDVKKSLEANEKDKADKKMKQAKKRSGGDNIASGDQNIKPSATPIKDPTAKMESVVDDKYGIFGKTMNDLLAAVNEVVGKKTEGSIKGSGTDRKAVLKRAFRAGEKQDQARGRKPTIRAPKGMKGRTSRGSMDAFSAKHKDKGIEKAYKAGFHGDYSGNAPDKGKERMKPQSNFPLNKDQMKARKRMRGK